MTLGKPTSSHLDYSFLTWGGQQHTSDRHRKCSVNIGYSHGNNPSFTFSYAVKQKFMVIRELARGLEERHWYEPVVCERKEQVLGYESPPSVAPTSWATQRKLECGGANGGAIWCCRPSVSVSCL